MNSLLVCIFAGIVVGGANKLAIDLMEKYNLWAIIGFYGVIMYLFGFVIGCVIL